jgi:hypothetical protein
MRGHKLHTYEPVAPGGFLTIGVEVYYLMWERGGRGEREGGGEGREGGERGGRRRKRISEKRGRRRRRRRESEREERKGAGDTALAA